MFDSPGVSLTSKLQFYRAAVLSILLYGAGESWAPSPPQLHQLDVFNTQCLRRILRVWWTPEQGLISNDELHARTQVPPISLHIKMYRLRWLGHAARGGIDRVVPQLLFAHVVHGDFLSQARGVRMWLDAAKADVVEFIGSDWYFQCQNRKAWESAIRTHYIP